jgi:hypothetical protein
MLSKEGEMRCFIKFVVCLIPVLVSGCTSDTVTQNQRKMYCQGKVVDRKYLPNGLTEYYIQCRNGKGVIIYSNEKSQIPLGYDVSLFDLP